MLIKYLDRSRFAPTLFVLQSSSWLEKEFNLCPFEVINFRSFFRIGSYWQFLKFVKNLREQRIDCIQTHFIDSNIIGIVAAKLAGIPRIISSRRDQGYWHTPTTLLPIQMLNCCVSCFVANCYATAKWASETEGIPPERIKVIYNGVELDQFSHSPEFDKKIIRHNIGIPENSVVIGIVANLRPVKRIDIFLRASATVNLHLPQTIFLIVGDGEQRQELEALASKLGISDKTHFLGKRTDVPNILAAFDIAVLSSDSESFSNSIVEYLATGLPIVSTDVGGCREIIIDTVNGYLVPPANIEVMADRIIELVNSCNFEEICRVNKEKAWAIFSSEAMVASFERLFIES